MAESNPFYSRIQYHTEITNEVDNPEAEITDHQARELFDRIRDLTPELEFRANLSVADDMRDSGLFAEEDLAQYLARLEAEEDYEIFGHRVILLTGGEVTEGSWDSSQLMVYRDLQIDFGRQITESDVANVMLNNYGGISYSYEHAISELRAKPAFTPEQMLLHYLFPDPPEKVEKFLEISRARRELSRALGDRDFTQARWANMMSVLDMVGWLKELGLTSTEDLNWQPE